MSSETELKKLKEQNERLQEQLNQERELRKQVEKEKEQIEQEKQRIEEAKKKIEKAFEEFRAKHACTVDNLKTALKIKGNVSKPAKQSARKKRKGHGRKTPEHVDREEEIPIDKCPHCNTRLRGKTVSTRARFVTTIHIINPAEVIRNILHRKWCHVCEKLVEPDVPGVLPNARFSLNIMLMVLYLHLALRVPGAKIREYFHTLHGIQISDGEIPHILTQLAREYGDYYTYLEKLVRDARVKHTDSTGWRISGKNYAAWVFIAKGVVLYKISKSTSHKMPLKVLGKIGKNLVLVVDRHSAFRTLAQKAGYLLQLCWSHILQDSKELSKNYGAEGRYVHKHLKEIYAQAKSLNHQATSEQVDQLKGEIIQLTNRHYKSPTIRRFVNNLAYRDLENLFRFTTDPQIDPTNNISERELRHLVMIRRISHGSRSRRGANATTQLLSVIQTLRLRQQNPLIGLQNILNPVSTN